MTRIVRAALAYWAAIFALGFVLGTARVLWIAPALGETGAVLAELPVMLGASWLAARRFTRTHAIRTARAALAMGALAFALLMGAEALLAAVLAGQGPADWLAAMLRLPGLLGLAGQTAFALMPVAARGRD